MSSAGAFRDRRCGGNHHLYQDDVLARSIDSRSRMQRCRRCGRAIFWMRFFMSQFGELAQDQ